MGDFYEYEKDFEADAALSSSSFLTPLLDNRPMSRTEEEEKIRKSKRQERMRK